MKGFNKEHKKKAEFFFVLGNVLCFLSVSFWMVSGFSIQKQCVGITNYDDWYHELII